MSLFLSQDSDGKYQLAGVANDPSVVVPLGRRYFHVGAHWIGFDDSFELPVVVRAYFDPAADPAAVRELMKPPGLTFIGYMQFMQLSFRGAPFPPGVYGGQLATRQPYAFGLVHQFIDFMGPSDARRLRIEDPFYPYNAMLVDGNEGMRRPADFGVIGLPNGALYLPGNSASRGATVASLIGEIAPGLLTPQGVTRCLTPANLLLTISNPDELSTTEPYRIALDWLKTKPLLNNPDGDPTEVWLADLDESQVSAQVVGDYTLLTLPDPEEFSYTLVVYTKQRSDGGEDVLVNLLSEYDMAGPTANAARELLWRIKPYLNSVNLAPIGVDGRTDTRVNQAPTGRGYGGLYSPPYTLAPSDFCIELTYTTIPIGYSAERTPTRGNPRYRVFTGLTWSTLFQYDEDTGRLTLSAVAQPTEKRGFDVLPAVTQFNTAWQAPAAARQAIDKTNFTEATMRRDNFAAGNKLRFIDSSGDYL